MQRLSSRVGRIFVYVRKSIFWLKRGLERPGEGQKHVQLFSWCLGGHLEVKCLSPLLLGPSLCHPLLGSPQSKSDILLLVHSFRLLVHLIICFATPLGLTILAKILFPICPLYSNSCSVRRYSSRQGVTPPAFGELCDVFFEELGFRRKFSARSENSS